MSLKRLLTAALAAAPLTLCVHSACTADGSGSVLGNDDSDDDSSGSGNASGGGIDLTSSSSSGGGSPPCLAEEAQAEPIVLDPAQQRLLNVTTAMAQAAATVRIDGLLGEVTLPIASSTALAAPWAGRVVRVLADEDVRVKVKGAIARVEGEGDRRTWHIDLEPSNDQQDYDLYLFSRSNSMIPFGPYLAIGGAICALYATHVSWFLREGYPAWARSLFGGS